MNIFKRAEAAASKPVKKGVVQVDNSHVIKDEEFHKSVNRYKEILEELSDLNAEKAMLYDELKQHGMRRFLSEYNKTGVYPKSVMISVKANGKDQLAYKFIPTSRCTKVDETKKADLQYKYGEEIVQTNTEYIFNSEVLSRNMESISKMISDSETISDEDKENLIRADVKYAIKTDMVKQLTPEQRTEEFVEDIGVICMVKNPCVVSK